VLIFGNAVDSSLSLAFQGSMHSAAALATVELGDAG
jgi:hypothetical protein